MICAFCYFRFKLHLSRPALLVAEQPCGRVKKIMAVRLPACVFVLCAAKGKEIENSPGKEKKDWLDENAADICWLISK